MKFNTEERNIKLKYLRVYCEQTDCHSAVSGSTAFYSECTLFEYRLRHFILALFFVMLTFCITILGYYFKIDNNLFFPNTGVLSYGTA